MEQICADQIGMVNDTTCDNDRGTMDLDDFEDLTNKEKEIYYSTVGCRKCVDGAKPYVEYNTETGIHVNRCKAESEINVNIEDEPCGPGEITQLEGVLEEIETIACRNCSEIIPNCISCNNDNECTLCEIGYK